MTDELSKLEIVEVWRNNPVKFVKDFFGVELEKWQADFMKAIVKSDRVAIKSGHGVGKTATLAWIIYWWCTTRRPHKVACTAPSATQLRDVLWAELRKWKQKLPKVLADQYVIKTDRFELLGSDGSFASARTARRENPDAFQGFHEDNMLFIIDEASGVPEEIFIAGAGSMSTKGAKTIMTGNPTQRGGYFYDAFNKMSGFWKKFTVGCHQSSRVNPDWVEEMKAKYGDGSNVFKIRCLGEFGDANDDSIIPYGLIEQALARDVAPHGDRLWGVDVARFGDDRTALVKRTTNSLIEAPKTWRGKDIVQVANLIRQEYQNTPISLLPQNIFIDVIGLGAGVVDLLKSYKLPVVAVNVAERASEGDRFMKLRDELWWKGREWFEQLDVTLPLYTKGTPEQLIVEELMGELGMPNYKIEPTSGKIKAMSKDDMKKEHGYSPDIADAFLLTFANPVRRLAGSYDDLYGEEAPKKKKGQGFLRRKYFK
jgi:hypothetical protein